MKAAKGLAPAGDPQPTGWRNVGGADRMVRILAGAAMLAAPVLALVSGVTASALALFGWVPLATGLAGWCPFYAVLGISSRRLRSCDIGRGRRR